MPLASLRRIGIFIPQIAARFPQMKISKFLAEILSAYCEGNLLLKAIHSVLCRGLTSVHAQNASFLGILNCGGRPWQALMV